MTYLPIPPQREVADRCEVVEIGVALQARLQLRLGFQELLVLQLQFGLVYCQLLLEAPEIGFALQRFGRVPTLHSRLRFLAQTGRIRGPGMFYPPARDVGPV